jgi:hypothetical protein
VQTVDLAPTLLECFDREIPEDMRGTSLARTIADDQPVRTHGLFGMHGAQVNCTDGRYVYMRAPVNHADQPQFEYTLMPTHMRARFSVEELKKMTLSEPLSFSKGCQVLRIESPGGMPGGEPMEMPTKNLLFDLQNDPHQKQPLQDADLERQMIGHLRTCMQAADAPTELYERLGI